MANCGQLPIGGCWLPIDHTGKCINPEVAERVMEELRRRSESSLSVSIKTVCDRCHHHHMDVLIEVCENLDCGCN